MYLSQLSYLVHLDNIIFLRIYSNFRHAHDTVALNSVLYSGPVIGVVPRTPEAEEEDTILESYLKGMKIKDGQLTLPPVSERPDEFDLFYQRRSRRRIYEYQMDDETFTLLVSKYQEKTVDAAETEASDFDEIDTQVLF